MLDRLRLHWMHRRDRLSLLLRQACTPGLQIHPQASSNLAVARYVLAPGARLRIGSGVVAERIPNTLNFVLHEGAEVEIQDRTWLRSQVGPVYIVAFEGARISIGPDCLINGAHLSAKQSVKIGCHSTVGVGSRVFDGDQHDFDQEHPERVEPVRIGDHVWITSDVTVLRGVCIADHSVVGARSVVTKDVPEHSVVFGAPAEVRGSVGDRTHTR